MPSGAPSRCNRAWRRWPGCDGWPALEIRVGVSAGEVTAEDDDWFGTPVVEAARLCGLAGPQQILVTEHAVTDAVTRQFGLRTVGPLNLKGFPEPVCCAEVPWSEAATPGLLAPLPPALLTAGHPDAVGLEPSVTLGLDLFDAAAAGFARGLVVSGPPRVGRTRFVAELVAAARNRGGGPVAVLYGCGARSVAPLAVIAEALRRFVLWAPLAVVGALADIDDLGVLVPALPLRLGRPPSSPDDRSPTVERLLVATLRAFDTISAVVTDDPGARRRRGMRSRDARVHRWADDLRARSGHPDHRHVAERRSATSNRRTARSSTSSRVTRRSSRSS